MPGTASTGGIRVARFAHARSKMSVMPRPMAPIYEPHLVAEAIIFAAAHPRRDIVVGGAGTFLLLLQRLSPALLDRLMVLGDVAVRQQQSDLPNNQEDILFTPAAGASSITGEYAGQTTPSSPYTRYLELYPGRKHALLLATTVGAIALLRRLGR